MSNAPNQWNQRQPPNRRPSNRHPSNRQIPSQSPSRPPVGPSLHRYKALWAGGAITLLALATVLPTQVSSQAIAEASCEQVVKSGAEISRGQLSNLLAVPVGSNREAVLQAVAEPYCTLPLAATATSASPAESESKATLPLTSREAYPLAFDRSAWVVLNYGSDGYQGYDFLFKP
ncbi:MAG: hypothetical protein WA883_09570 [Phormidesmis sp.]